MPANVVKTERDERLWQEAKEQGKGKGWAYVMGIFKRMRDRTGGAGPALTKSANRGKIENTEYSK